MLIALAIDELSRVQIHLRLYKDLRFEGQAIARNAEAGHLDDVGCRDPQLLAQSPPHCAEEIDRPIWGDRLVVERPAADMEHARILEDALAAALQDQPAIDGFDHGRDPGTVG